jgi:hypothetical protein
VVIGVFSEEAEMIIIWDNDQYYSNHEIWFIELQPGENLEEATQVLLSRLSWDDHRGYIIGVVEALEWRKPSELSTMDDWIENYIEKLSGAMALSEEYETKYAPALRELPAVWRKRIADILTEEAECWDKGQEEDALRIAADLVK